MEQAIHDIRKANAIIKRQYRYNCGLMEDDTNIKDSRAKFFFESPDGQNGDLFCELKKLGYINSGYNAPYYWGVSKDGYHIQYTEGDIYIRPLEALKTK